MSSADTGRRVHTNALHTVASNHCGLIVSPLMDITDVALANTEAPQLIAAEAIPDNPSTDGSCYYFPHGDGSALEFSLAALVSQGDAVEFMLWGLMPMVGRATGNVRRTMYRFDPLVRFDATFDGQAGVGAAVAQAPAIVAADEYWANALVVSRHWLKDAPTIRAPRDTAGTLVAAATNDAPVHMLLDGLGYPGFILQAGELTLVGEGVLSPGFRLAHRFLSGL